MLYFFEVSSRVLQKYRLLSLNRFFWQSYKHKKKHRLTNWNILCTPKDFGGLGMQNLDIKISVYWENGFLNLSTKEGTWQDLLTRKYLSNKTFWSRLMKVKDQFLARGSFWTHSGIGSVLGRHMDWQQTSQNWVPSPYNIVREKEALVAHVLSTTHLNVSFEGLYRIITWLHGMSLCHK